MDSRVFEAGAAVSPPSAPTSPSEGYPTNGNPATGTPATVPGEWWFHMLGEEIRAVIVAAGLTPDHADLDQLLSALRSTGVFQTAPQFDSDTSVATTEFVRRSGMQKSGVVSVAGATNITGEHIGGTISCSGAGGYTLTLPGAAAVAQGATVTIINSGTGPVTVQRGGADLIYMGSATPTSIIVAAGDTVTLEAWTSIWIASGGASLLPYSAQFASTFASNGHQTFPGGLIMQRVQVAKPTSANVSVTWPIPFPTAFLFAVVGWAGDVPVTDGVTFFNPTTTGATIRSPYGAAGAAVSLLAIGN